MRFLLLCSALLLSAGLHAQTTVTLDNALTTGHSYRGLRLSHTAWQPAVTVDRGDWSFSLWSNVPLHASEQTEIDPIVTYSHLLGMVAAHTGLQVYTYPGASGGATTHSYEIFAGADVLLPLTATFPVGLSTTVFYDLRLQTAYVEANLSRTVSFGLIGVPLDLTFNLIGGYSDGRNLAPDTPGPRRRDAYRYVGVGVEAAFKLREHLTLKLGITCDTTSNVGPGQPAPAQAGATVTLSQVW